MIENDQDPAENSGDDQFPWEDIESSRQNQKLQSEHPVSEARQHYLALAKACPKCATPASELIWLYFESPSWTWEHLCGRAGWMTVCDHCHHQVDFFMELLN